MVRTDDDQVEPLRIKRPSETLRSQAQSTIRAAIFDGHLAPGQNLVERELCERMQISRPILREALAHIEARGLIERNDNRGYAVCKLSIRTVRQVYEVRSALEELAFGLFSERASEVELDGLKIALKELRTAFLSENRTSIREATTRYYACILEGCGNFEIGNVLGLLHDRISLLRTHSMSQKDRWKFSLAEIEAITQAVIDGDSEAARAASRVHIQLATKAVFEGLQAKGEESLMGQAPSEET